MTPGRPRGGRPCALVAKAVLGAAVVGGAVVYVIVRPRRVEVEGRSMEPTLAPGDRLLVTRASHLQPGDVVAARDPRDHRRIVVKRVGALLGDEVVLRGDNPWASTDSRSFGTVPRRAVLGRVVRRYAPGWRAGPVL